MLQTAAAATGHETANKQQCWKLSNEGKVEKPKPKSNIQWGQNLKLKQSRQPTLIFIGRKLPIKIRTVNPLILTQTSFASTPNMELETLNASSLLRFALVQNQILNEKGTLK